MSRSQTTNASVELKALAFDYVTGVLRGTGRAAFAEQLKTDIALQTEVYFWEEELMKLSDSSARLAPDPELWNKISQRLQSSSETKAKTSVNFSWLWPSISAFASVLLVISLWFNFSIAPTPSSSIKADYVAVLTNAIGTPQLTVLTETGGEQLLLKWESLQIANNKNVQLWAISKRDGQIRPLAVFSTLDSDKLSISVTDFRLIKDASHLLLTEEEVGGSALDEPSEIVLAKGPCVFLVKDSLAKDNKKT
jgi:anti-sigma-K factor RskA